MIPRAEIPRSSFKIETAHKTTFNAGDLVPIYVDEVLPGDTFNLRMTAFTRLATPLYPTMDNLHLDSFFFFVPNRLIWSNWQKFMGQQDNPSDSTSYVVPTTSTPASGYAVGSIFDYMGLPTVGQVNTGSTVSHNVLHLRAYNLIWNQWFRDENLQNSVTVNMGDGPDTYTDYSILKRGKRKDYFTGALPWPQKGTAVSLPLGTSAPVVSTGASPTFTTAGYASAQPLRSNAGSIQAVWSNTTTASADAPATWATTGLYADLSTATAATINQLRQSFQIQKLLERDARGGTRYTEIIRAHFGVISPDARLQRPEYLGGGSTPIQINPIAQTSGTNASGTSTPLGNLAAMGTGLAHGHGFTQSFTEHGVIIGLVSVRADLTYQQGLRKMWSRSTRYDYYFPAWLALGSEIYFFTYFELYFHSRESSCRSYFGCGCCCKWSAVFV